MNRVTQKNFPSKIQKNPEMWENYKSYLDCCAKRFSISNVVLGGRLKNLNFRNMSFFNVQFLQGEFEKLDFTNSLLDGCSFERCNVRDSYFGYCKIRNLSIPNSKFGFSSFAFSKIELNQTPLAVFKDCDFHRAKVVRLPLKNIELMYNCFYETDLRGLELDDKLDSQLLRNNNFLRCDNMPVPLQLAYVSHAAECAVEAAKEEVDEEEYFYLRQQLFYEDMDWHSI